MHKIYRKYYFSCVASMMLKLRCKAVIMVG